MSFCDDESSDLGLAGQSKLESFLFMWLLQVCLGEGAKEESNVVEVTAMNHQGKTISVPIANLHVSCLPMVSLGEFELKAPVTIRLKAGTGPVTVSGLHLIGNTSVLL
ncbi:hypothetical protein L3Q82_011823, partial [Scortum barcoo]